MANGSGQLVANLVGWKQQCRRHRGLAQPFGYAPGLNASYIELDGAGSVANRVYQDIRDGRGCHLRLSFLHSPRPGNTADSNRFDVYWGATRIFKMWTDDGTNLTDTRWRRVDLVVAGTGGAVRLDFREADADDRGVLIDDVRVTQR